MTTTFLDYLSLRVHEASPVGDLARDVADAERTADVWPHDVMREPGSIMDLMDHVSPYGSAVMEAAARAWLDYQRYLERERAQDREAA